MSVSECNPRIACRMREDGHWEAVHFMSSEPGHLPECPEVDPAWTATPWCICDRLRAAEQRGREEAIQRVNIAASVVRNAALDAARDAVAALPLFDWFPAASARQNALAAIDALKEET